MSVLVRRPDMATIERSSSAADVEDHEPVHAIVEIARSRTRQIVGLSAAGARSLLHQLNKFFAPTEGDTHVTNPTRIKNADDLELDRILGTVSGPVHPDVQDVIARGHQAIEKMGGVAVEELPGAVPPITERKTDPAEAAASAAAALSIYDNDDFYLGGEASFAGHPAVSPHVITAADKPTTNGAAQAGYPLAGGSSKGWEKSYGGPGQNRPMTYSSGSGYSGNNFTSYHKCSHHCDPIQMGGHVVFAAAKRDFTAKDVAKVDVVYMLTTSMNTGDFKDFWGIFFCFPIADMTAPDPEMLRMHAERIASFARAGSRVMVFCEGGHGRTGTVLGTVLGVLEPTVEDPVLEIRRRHCSEAVETRAQIAAVFAALGKELPAYWAEPVSPSSKPSWRGQGKFWGGGSEDELISTRGAILSSDTCEVCHVGDILGPEVTPELLHWHGPHIRHDSCHEAMKASEAQEKKAAPKSSSKGAGKNLVHGSAMPAGLMSKKERKRRIKSLLDKTINMSTTVDGEDLITCPACCGDIEPEEAYEIMDKVGFHAECRKTLQDNGVIEWFIKHQQMQYKLPKSPTELEFTTGHPEITDWETGVGSRLCDCVGDQPCVLLTPDGEPVAVVNAVDPSEVKV